jgi:hypothetical protein
VNYLDDLASSDTARIVGAIDRLTEAVNRVAEAVDAQTVYQSDISLAIEVLDRGAPIGGWPEPQQLTRYRARWGKDHPAAT